MSLADKENHSEATGIEIESLRHRPEYGGQCFHRMSRHVHSPCNHHVVWVVYLIEASSCCNRKGISRCPTAVTPSSFRSSAVRVRRTASSMSFSRKIASYFPRPRLRSQTTMS